MSYQHLPYLAQRPWTVRAISASHLPARRCFGDMRRGTHSTSTLTFMILPPVPDLFRVHLLLDNAWMHTGSSIILPGGTLQQGKHGDSIIVTQTHRGRSGGRTRRRLCATCRLQAICSRSEAKSSAQIDIDEQTTTDETTKSLGRRASSRARDATGRRQ